MKATTRATFTLAVVLLLCMGSMSAGQGPQEARPGDSGPVVEVPQAAQGTPSSATPLLGVLAFVGGGLGNLADGDNAVATGGHTNSASGVKAAVGGGKLNLASGHASTIAGGQKNRATNWYSTVGGGLFNRSTSIYATVSGGYGNKALSSKATVGGGRLNIADGIESTIAGGKGNKAIDWGTSVGGGSGNTASGDYATVGGGWGNSANGYNATVGGGELNASDSTGATVGGGLENHASLSFATVAGGYHNVASGDSATVPGGRFNSAAGNNSLAAGLSAKATHHGSFVWSSNERTDSWGDNTFTARAHGGARFYSATDAATGGATGVQLSSGGGSWGSLSTREAKELFEDVDLSQLLTTLNSLPVQTWSYRAQRSDKRHIGPVSEDFNGLFGYLFGEAESDTHINTMDAVGIALAAAKGLYAEDQEQSARIAALEAKNSELCGLVEQARTENSGLRQRLDDLETVVAELAGH